MMNTIELIRVVARVTSISTAREKRRCRAARIMAPTAPTEADSVGVAIPARIEPSTARISSAGGSSETMI